MREDELYLCSELITVRANETAQIANLELISSKGCTVTTPEALPIGTKVDMQCLECPRGKKVCTECRFEGWVRNHEAAQLLGTSMQVEFEGRNWSAEEWHPRHLTSTREADAH